MENPAAWRGLKYPDSDLVGLLFRFARPRRDLHQDNPPAVDVGCGPGRHVRLLNEIGYRAVGIDNDPEMCAAARENGVEVLQVAVEEYRPAVRPALVVCWGIMMLQPRVADIVAGWEPDIVIADWRAPSSSCFHWPDNTPVPGRPGWVRLCRPGHVLHNCVYRSHKLSDCRIPGYELVHWQRSVRETAEERHEWWQTVHRRSGARGREE